jgi:DnaJ-class molecular chaperone
VDLYEAYELLGIDEAASEHEIKRAYRAHAHSAHPDSGGSVIEFIALQKAYNAALRAQRIKEAIAILSKARPSVLGEKKLEEARKDNRAEEIPSAHVSSEKEMAATVPDFPKSFKQALFQARYRLEESFREVSEAGEKMTTHEAASAANKKALASIIEAKKWVSGIGSPITHEEEIEEIQGLIDDLSAKLSEESDKAPSS